MKEKLKTEARRYAGFNNEKWGSVTGAALGAGMGVYMLVQHQEIIPVADAFIKIALEVTTIPLLAGFGALLLSNVGKAVDAVTNDTTAINAIMACRRMYKESRPEFLFFRNGERYINSYGEAGSELTLRHMESGESSDVIMGSSTEPSPRRATPDQYASGTDKEDGVVGYQGGMKATQKPAVTPPKRGIVTL